MSITVTNIGKVFKQYPTQWSRLADWVIPGSKPHHTIKWVLQDITFDVQPGEAVGIIGLNGAGKSTLLKLITGIIKPTTGHITVSGRVVALLELGIGFHPDFTGRQNARMAGQLLGYTTTEINQLMLNIQAFAEIDEYFDLPIRIYSSGMQMRLAFSVVTAQRPDVLIIDEALSVGDIYFQQKSFDRIREFQKHGTTLLFVSHDKNAIQLICDSAILLNEGRLKMHGKPEAVMDYYNALLASHKEQTVSQIKKGNNFKTISGTGEATIENISICDSENNILKVVFVGQKIWINIIVKVNQDLDSLVLGCGIKDRLGMMIFGTNTFHTNQGLTDLKNGETYIFSISCLANLGVGSYSIHTSLVRHHSHIEKNYHWIDGALFFEVFNKDKVEFVGCSWNEMVFEIKKV
jgi:lipopolysaccharide transport system ATP-binding protein